MEKNITAPAVVIQQPPRLVNYSLGDLFVQNLPLFYFLLTVLIVWSLIWKGQALYRSARNGQKGWFILLLILNTVGILEIIYLAFFSKPAAPRKK